MHSTDDIGSKFAYVKSDHSSTSIFPQLRCTLTYQKQMDKYIWSVHDPNSKHK